MTRLQTEHTGSDQSQSKNILTAEGLHKSFGRGQARVHVLRGLDLKVRRGEFLAVMGPSGCGKSTLLHVLGLMTRPDSGEIIIDGQSAPAGESDRAALRRTHIGFVFQRFNLLPVLSGADNVAISLRIRSVDVDGQVDTLFEQMGVAHAARRKPGQMSIGEQQRVAIVRAIAHKPMLLLADEPTGNLDHQNAESLLELFRRINRVSAQTIVMITHSREAAGYADRIAFMQDGGIFGTNSTNNTNGTNDTNE